MNKLIFRRLADQAAVEGAPLQHTDKIRWIKTANDDDRQFMAKANILQIVSLARNKQALLSSYNGSRILILAGFEPIDQPPEAMTPVPLTGGVFALAVYSLELESTASGAEIKNALDLAYESSSVNADEADNQGADDDGYDGHEVDQIAALFPKITALRLSEDSIIIDDIYRCVGLYMCKSNADCTLDMDSNLLEAMATIFESGQGHIPYYNLMQGMLSFAWVTFYLDVYRCIERLYLIPKIKNLASDLRIEGNILHYCRLVEQHLSWRPKEDEALKLLLSKCENAQIEHILRAFSVSLPAIDSDETKNKAIDKARELIYKLRNDIVHFRPINEIVKKNNEEWNSIITALVTCMAAMYEFYNKELSAEAIDVAGNIAVENIN